MLTCVAAFTAYEEIDFCDVWTEPEQLFQDHAANVA